MKKLLAIALAMVMLLAMGCSAAPAPSDAGANASPDAGTATPAAPDDAAEPISVALLLPGSINDAGWNAAAYNALMAAQEEFGLEVAFTESVPYAEQESTLRDYASQGYDLIVAHGDDFNDAVATVAPEFPGTSFAVANGNVSLENTVSMDVRNEEQGYIAGYALGLMTKTNKVGYVSSMEYTSQKRVENGFVQGLAASNPAAEAVVTYVGSFSDTTKAYEQTLVLQESGCDGVFSYAASASLGVAQACQEIGLTCILTSAAHAEVAADTCAFVVQTDMQGVIYDAIAAFVNGEFNQDLAIEGSFATDLFKVHTVNSSVIPDEILAQVQAKIDAMKDGSLVLTSREF